ncbi:bifunctional aspartate kinase/homoserine dehydrogenase I [Flavobacterium sp. NKUCC04_CG]|uniref:bifunctional aspartate kinase/homoserine dehydrogenase I n=1 Tax=Flavobacterium sp. NKUCC04_CG TaxID=2842121 RepID=UPI001C5BC1BB|nr:bifunctional aspartate kinase/homoserine dehydrogenase I [Flavobacterium sp. NKUCC04_CG]MBW3518953.1 bifunctional aspartate kinase/homoserine dehydrogenase I [Flavobacterium sp. NKUCC04_CG]
MKILKFGGKSLAQPQGFETVLSIIEKQYKSNSPFHVVVSAFGDTTNQLENLLEQAVKRENHKSALALIKEQHYTHSPSDISAELKLIDNLLEGISLLGDYSLKHKDLLLAQGEIIAAKTITHHLSQKGLPVHFVDARLLLKTDQNFGQAQPLDPESRQNILAYFEENLNGKIGIITGFIGSTSTGETTTLGRNGSNYSASLFASYLYASELQSYTHVNGIYTANPDWVHNAQKIEDLSYEEANEMAHLGASILHAKTIIPLLNKQIPLRILNTFNPEDVGTLISADSKSTGIRALSVLEKTSLIQLVGKGLLGKVGIDARIFETLAQHQISVNVIAQGASERGIAFVVHATDTQQAIKALRLEFKKEIETQDISEIFPLENVSVLSIIGQDLSTFNRSYNALINNQIVPLLISNTVTGRQISLVLHHHQLQKALNIIHGEIFGINKKINLFIFGVGTVGSVLIQQLLQTRVTLEEKKKVSVRIVGISNSKQLLFDPNGIGDDWENNLNNSDLHSSPESVFELTDHYHLENLIAVDLTASAAFTETYPQWIRNGFDLVAANKIANTQSFEFYQKLRRELKKHHKEFLYETNVGAGLPLIDTIQLLHQSGENITRIRGVFSGTLSYLFNEFSEGTSSLSSVLEMAISNGFTEPDPREDLNGNDVARKLLILARELDLANEMTDIRIQNLIPEKLQSGSVTHFLERLEELNPLYSQIKAKQDANHVLRYVGDLHGDLSQQEGAQLDVELISVPKASALGQLQGSDSIFEIYTESYGSRPIVIQGAGAGAKVTARGVFGDILRLVNRK